MCMSSSLCLCLCACVCMCVSFSHCLAGGEFVLKHAGDLDFVEREWFTPAEDLAAIYTRYGQPGVTADDIANCMRLGFLGIWANRVCRWPTAAHIHTRCVDACMCVHLRLYLPLSLCAFLSLSLSR
jgi:hypothetical protein